MTFKTISKAPQFEINLKGEVRNKKTGRLLKHSFEEKMGYPFVRLQWTKNKERKAVKGYIHRLMAETFLDKECEEYNVVLHKDDNPKNFSIENLKWGTQKQNMEQSSKTGFYSTVKKEVTLLSPKGEVIHVKGLRTFCDEQGLDWGNFQRMVNKKVIHRVGRKPTITKKVKGWSLYEE